MSEQLADLDRVVGRFLDDREIDYQRPHDGAYFVTLPGTHKLATNTWLVLGDHYTPAGFYALETLPSIALTTHYLHRVPRCEACSGIADMAGPLPWYKEMPLAAGL